MTPEDIGLPQQVMVFDEIAAVSGTPPPVIDAAHFLRAPEAYLRTLCTYLQVEFSDRMVQWPAGRRASDGVWARYWYSAVEASTGFEPWRPREIRLEGQAASVAEACLPHYRRLRAEKDGVIGTREHCGDPPQELRCSGGSRAGPQQRATRAVSAPIALNMPTWLRNQCR